MPGRFAGLCAWILFQAFASGQSTFQLTASDYHPLANPTADVVFPLKCDEKGSVYYLFSARGFGRFDVAKFGSDGSQKAIYSYAGVSELKNDSLLADSVGDHGEMYELLKAPGQRVVLLRFSEDGQLESTGELDSPEPFTPAQLDVLPNGALFVSGTLVGEKSGQHAGRPVNAFYDASGHWLKEIRLKKDPGALKQALKGPDRAGAGNDAVHFGMTAVGDDGNLYVARATSPAIVYVVSSGGRVERALTVQAPASGAVPVALLAHSGRVAIEFSFPDTPNVTDARIRLVDARSGRTVSDYAVAQDVGSAVACYDGEQFTFVSMKDGWPSIVQARTR